MEGVVQNPNPTLSQLWVEAGEDRERFVELATAHGWTITYSSVGNNGEWSLVLSESGDPLLDSDLAGLIAWGDRAAENLGKDSG